MNKDAKIIYTKTDEAPALATYSLLPVIEAFTAAAGVKVETRDISLAGRIIAAFPDYLKEDQRISDDLAELGELVKTPEANVIKLPNISASIPQLKAAVKELQQKGYALPDYPEEPSNEKESGIKARYDKIKGSAVNPVLREGNSDRRAPRAVKEYAKAHPHSMGEWSSDSLSHVSHMEDSDFYGTEKSVEIQKESSFTIVHKDSDGNETVLKESTPLKPGEILDAAVMSRSALRSFLKEQIKDAKEKDLLFSIHLKATMMKVSDPIIFGHAVWAYCEELFEKHSRTFKALGVDPNMGLGDLTARLEELSNEEKSAILKDLDACYSNGPDLAMVDSDRGITNLHVSSDVIIDASMPAAIRSSGQMWGPDGKQKDTKFVIPDRSYAGVYQAAINFCKKNGAFNPSEMGSVSNVGLMAQKAEEYGSHDKTFEVPSDGTVSARDEQGNILLEQSVETGDIFRMCQVKDFPIQDWIKLAVKRARSTGQPAVFWLDQNRAHDAQLIRKVEKYLPQHDTEGLEIYVMAPEEAAEYSMERMKKGLDTISVTGNVLRDYLTDLFPILEVGTSAKMLSIVPLMNGGGLFETGAGGSAPKHVQQVLKENHLRWDSLGEFLALAVSLDHLSESFNNPKAKVLADTLDEATGKLLENNKAPSRKVGEIDNRGSHYYLARYWAEALALQHKDEELHQAFCKVAKELNVHEKDILDELLAVQGKPADLGGYYKPDERQVNKVMRPSTVFNHILEDYL